MKKDKLLVFLFFICCAWQLPAALEIKNARVNNPAAGAQINVFDEKYSTVPNWWTNGYNYTAHEDFIRFGLDETQHLVYPVDFQSTISFNIVAYANNGTSTQITGNSLVITYRNNGIYTDKAIKKLNGDYARIVINVTGITTINLNTSAVIATPSGLFMEGEVQTTRFYAFPSTTWAPSSIPTELNYNLITRNCGAGVCVTDMEVYWNYMIGAEEYELEWTWVNNYAGAPLVYNFAHDGTRVITTGNTYKIPLLYEKGYITFRVRAIGRRGPDPITDRVETPWSSNALYLDYGSVSNFPNNIKYQVSTANSSSGDLLNWGSTMTFAEDGKKGAGVSYMDGLLMGRQSQAKLNTENKTIAQQTIYDFQGRPAVSVLPVPMDRYYFLYEPALNMNTSGTPQIYTKLDFDVDNTACAPATGKMSKSASLGASKYYSPSNTNQAGAQGYLPDAAEYPFVQVEYAPDKTGRVVAQSMPGDAHKLQSGHETKFYYTNPGSSELKRLFGSEAGNVGHYDKDIVVDANRQASATYKDMKGRVVATALMGDRPTALDTIAGYNKVAPLTDDHILFNKTDNSNYSIVSSKKIFVEAAGSIQTFVYEFTPQDFTDATCAPLKCFDCIYEVEFSIKDECGAEVSKTGYPAGQPVTATVGAPITTGNVGTCDNPSLKFELSPQPISVTFPALGNYVVTKTLRVSDTPIDQYIIEYLAGNTCIKSLQQLIQDETNAIDFSSCGTNCQACSTSVVNYTGSLTPQKKAELIAKCMELCQPYNPCEAGRRAMISDFVPGGQYAAYTQVNGVYSSNDPTSIFSTGSVLGIIYTGITYPANLYVTINGVSTNPAILTLANYIKYFKREWAELFLPYHPEYAYLEFCNLNKASDQYDYEMLQVTSFDEACAKGFLKPLSGLSGSSCMNSCTTANYDPFFAAGGQGLTANLIAQNNSYTDAYGNAKPSAAAYTYRDYMLNAFNQVYPLPSNLSSPPAIYNMARLQAGSGQGQFGCDNCTKDKEWLMFRELYLTYKFRLVTQRKTDYVIQKTATLNGYRTGFNGCMVNSGFTNFAPSSANSISINNSNVLVLSPPNFVAPYSLNFLPFTYSNSYPNFPPTSLYTFINYPVSKTPYARDNNCTNNPYHNPWGQDTRACAGNISGDINQPCSATYASYYASKTARFPQLPFDITSLINSYNSQVPAPNNIMPSNSSLFPSLTPAATTNYCNDLCASYAEEWMYKLKDCNGAIDPSSSSYNPTTYNNVKNALIAVCADGCDANNPFGSSSINPAAPNPAFNSFAAVLTSFFGSTLAECSEDLLSMPRPYGSNYTGTSSNPSQLDTCGCNKILKAKYLFVQNAGSLPPGITIVDKYFNYLYGNLPNNFAQLECRCSSPWGTPNPINNWYTAQVNLSGWSPSQQSALSTGGAIYVPAYLACPKPCVNCAAVVAEINAYNTAHPTYAASENYPILLATHLNNYFNFNLGYTDYMEFYNNCNAPPNCGSQVPVAAKLVNVINQWFTLYNNSLPTGPYSPGVVFGNGAAPAIPALFNSAGTPDFLTCTSASPPNTSGLVTPCSNAGFNNAGHGAIFANLQNAAMGQQCSNCELMLDGMALPPIGVSPLSPQQLPVVTAVYFGNFGPIPGSALNYNFKFVLNTSSVHGYGYLSCLPAMTPCNVTLCDRGFETVKPLDDCATTLLNNAYNNALAQFQEQNRAVKDNFTRRYKEKCLGLTDEKFERTYSLREYHYTLYYYDQAGNLRRTVPPKGVVLLNPAQYNNTPAHTYVTGYSYQSYNAPLTSQSPDEIASTEYVYDKLGRIVASANAKQTAAGAPGPYSSYTLYDNLGRIIEVGEVNASIATLRNAVAANNFVTAVTTPVRKQVIKTYYDQALNATISNLFPGNTQKNLRNRVATVSYEETDDNNSATYNHATHYSYDEHGNVKNLVQENGALYNFATPYFTLEYDYDLVSGNVNKVSYQKGRQDVFFHKYEYDDDNRLHTVYTSKDGLYWDRDAKYFYYDHGPLARRELGEQKVHAEDFAYTIQGWIKAVNSNALDVNADMGKDGTGSNFSSTVTDIHKYFGRDAMGYSLNYFSNGTLKDYTAIKSAGFNTGTNKNLVADISAVNNNNTGFGLLNAGPDLFNGNISSMVTSIIDKDPTNTVTDNTAFPQLTAYRYDQLHRIKQMKAYRNFSAAGNAWSAGTYDASYESTFTYDKNGNIKTLNRNGITAALSSGKNAPMDVLTYTYLDNNGFNTNKLIGVNDAVVGSGYSTDIKGTSSAVAGNVPTYDYEYDEIGNLLRDKKEFIDNIVWTVDRKVKEVRRNAAAMFAAGKNLPNLYFEYDANRQRVVKIARPIQNTAGYPELPAYNWTYTYYVRDASGNIMATYNNLIFNPGPSAFCVTQATEFDVYGSSRLGTDVKDILAQVGGAVYNSGTGKFQFSTPSAAHTFYNAGHVLGNGAYELNNHLDNVLTVASDRKVMNSTGSTFNFYTADVLETHDYYPFGYEMPARSFGNQYPNNFNGQRDDKWDGNGGNYLDFGARIHDARLGRFFTPDPARSGWSFESPFIFAGNTPIQAIDIYGEKIYFVNKDGTVLDLSSEADVKKIDDATFRVAYATLLRTEAGKELIEKYKKSTTHNIYIRKNYRHEYHGNNLAGTLGDVSKLIKNNRFSSDNLDNGGQKVWPNSMKIFETIDFSGENGKTSLIALSRERFEMDDKITSVYDDKNKKWIATNNTHDKYDYAEAIYHEIWAHVEYPNYVNPGDKISENHHNNYGSYTSKLDMRREIPIDPDRPGMGTFIDANKLTPYKIITKQLLNLRSKDKPKARLRSKM